MHRTVSTTIPGCRRGGTAGSVAEFSRPLPVARPSARDHQIWSARSWLPRALAEKRTSGRAVQASVRERHQKDRPAGSIPTWSGQGSVAYTHLRAHETDSYLVCRLLLEKKKKNKKKTK